MAVSTSVLEQLDWYNDEIDKRRKQLGEKRQEYLSLDSEVSRMERERSKLFRIAVNLTHADR